MKPAPFAYLRAESLEHALAVLKEHGPDAKVLAGGQSLIPLLNFRLARPKIVLDINRLTELATMERQDRALVLGALTRHRTLETSPTIRQELPLLAEAARYIGHTAIRTRGTIGGSLAHADPAAELGMACLALNAELELQSQNGSRRIPLDEFFLGYYVTSLAPEELLTRVIFPPPPPSAGWAVEEFALRHGDFALAAVAVQVVVDPEGRIGEARLALAGVAPSPIRARSVEAALLGREARDLPEIAALVTEDIQPEDDIHASASYRRELARILTRRALLQAYRKASERRM